jgi:uncharacterized protein YhfF
MKRTYAIVGSGLQISPNVASIDAFLERAIAHNPELGRDHHVRWIGLDEETTLQIVNFIKSGEKVATFTLPWVNEAKNWPNGRAGLPIILLSCDGQPLLMVQVTEVIEILFGNIDFSITGLDGPPVRDPQVWLELHTHYWNTILQDLSMKCSADMPVLVEKFKSVYPP